MMEVEIRAPRPNVAFIIAFISGSCIGQIPSLNPLVPVHESINNFVKFGMCSC